MDGALSVEQAVRELARLASVDVGIAPPAPTSAGPLPVHDESARLKLAEARYRALIEQIPAVTFLAALDGKLTDIYVSPQIESLLGFTQDEWVGDPTLWFRQLHPDDRETMARQFAETIATGKPLRGKCRAIARDGRIVWVYGEARFVRDDGGEAKLLQGIAFDITEQERALETREELVREQVLRAAADRERRQLLTLLEQVPAVVGFLRGPELVFEFAHPTIKRAIGGRDVTGQPLSVAIPEQHDQPFHERLRRVYETGAPFTQREGLAWFDIDRRAETYWDSVYLAVRDGSGRIEGVMTFDVEVTESVRARRELEVANRAKDEFLATMSHELRTPLNAILGWATILNDARRPHDAKLTRGLQAIERNARAQERLVGDLLDVSRIITGKLHLRLQRTDMSSVIRAAADVVRPAADAKGVELLVHLDPDLGANIGDPDRLQQVVWNLLSNAVRHTQRGGRVTVTGQRSASGIFIGVQDTGSGIPAEHLPHIFERFRQVDSSTTRSHGGLGLGLAIVRHLVEAHGGSVEAYSMGLGHGATFTVALPIRALDVAPAPGGAEAENEGDGPESPRSVGTDVLDDVRVLVVDDDADSLELIVCALQDAGANVTPARSAREALAATGPFDVIVSDIGMPDVDGYSFIRSVRTRESDAAVPAIALTAYARAEDAERAKRAGYQQHFAKPVDGQKLLEAVKQWAELRPHATK